MFALLAAGLLMTAQPSPETIAVIPQIANFIDEYRVVISTDRVAVIRVRDGKRSVLGIGNPLKDAGPTFADVLGSNEALRRDLGPALSGPQTAIDRAIVYQIFDGGAIVKEVATKLVWTHVHARRHAPPRPASEIVRHPSFGYFTEEYDYTAHHNRVEIRRAATNQTAHISANHGRFEVSAPSRRLMDRDVDLRDRLGVPMSPETRIFDGALTVQVFAGGAVLHEPASDRTWYSWHARRHLATNDGPRIALPADPNTIVLSFDWRGGNTPPRKTNSPYLTIRADGLATVVDPFGDRPNVQKRYSPRELQELLDFMIRENRFFSLDSDRLAAEIRKGPTILDAPTTALRITTAQRSHEVRCRAAEPYAEALPRSVDLRNFAAIERRIVEEMERIRPSRN